MRFKNKLAAAALALSTLTATAHAEQPAAEQYRAILRSGNFYVEYQTVRFWDGEAVYDRPVAVAGQSGSRIIKTQNQKGVMLPKVMFQNGKYYRFQEKDAALALEAAQMDNPSLNPREGWQNIRGELALPEELSALYWDDPYRVGYYVQNAPRYNGSSKRMAEKISLEIAEKNAKGKRGAGLFGGLFGGIGGKSKKSKTDNADMTEYDCDQYISDILNLDGSVAASTVYNFLYSSGQLMAIQKYFLCAGMEDLLSQIVIRKIAADIPLDAFRIERETKIYGAGLGDMNDLLESPVQIGTMGGAGNAK